MKSKRKSNIVLHISDLEAKELIIILNTYSSLYNKHDVFIGTLISHLSPR